MARLSQFSELLTLLCLARHRPGNEKSGGRVASALSYMDSLSKSRYLCGFLLLNINRPLVFYLI